MGTKCGTTTQGALLACLVLLCRSLPVQILINEAILTFKRVAGPPRAKVGTDKNMGQSLKELATFNQVSNDMAAETTLPENFYPFHLILVRNLFLSHFLFYFPFLLHVLSPICNHHKASTQRLSLTASINSILLEGPPLMPFRGIFPFFQTFLSFPIPPFPSPSFSPETLDSAECI